jgi:hypothetical protein
MKSVLNFLLPVVLAFAGALVISAVGGCSQVRAAKISNMADAITQVAPVVCEIAESFSENDVNIPGADKCDTAITFMNREETVIALTIVDCAKKYPSGSGERETCIIEAGWPVIKAKLALLSIRDDPEEIGSGSKE